MKELPNPTFDISPISLPRGSLHQSHPTLIGANQITIAANVQVERAGIEVAWAKHQSEVREAQRLRYDIFATEMGARIKLSLIHI